VSDARDKLLQDDEDSHRGVSDPLRIGRWVIFRADEGGSLTPRLSLLLRTAATSETTAQSAVPVVSLRPRKVRLENPIRRLTARMRP
jgi:hypothetical protein